MQKRKLIVLMALGVGLVVIGGYLYFSQIREHSSTGTVVSITAVDCSASRGQCDLTLVNKSDFNVSTTGIGTITFNGQEYSLLCQVVDLTASGTKGDSCVVEGGPPSSGTAVTGMVSLSNGEDIAFSGRFDN